ncbi:MAG: hypothetical protein Phog2KO_49760 [Phototrophicaceae bacterium]
MSYKLHCLECSTAIPPENINVQQTIAACPSCGAVFNFADKIPTGQKIKRRKSKKPDNMTQIETEHSLRLVTDYLQTTGYKLWTGVGILVMASLYGLILAGTLSDSEFGPAALFTLMFLPMILWLIGMIFAKQTVEVNSDELKHEIRLANVPFYQRKIAMDDVVDIELAETAITAASTAEARYNIYAEKYDGRQDMFIQNLPEEMATYTQQTLSSYVKADSANDVSLRLQDDVIDDDMVLVDEPVYQEITGKTGN